ncbi:MAG: PepSY domain-containing protein [Methylomicrobium sp.]
MIKFITYLLILVVSPAMSGADAAGTGPYALPPNKVNLESCSQAALTLHPGVIEVQREQRANGNLGMLYQITMHDGSGWIVLCDMATGKIIRDQKEFGEGSALQSDPAPK